VPMEYDADQEVDHDNEIAGWVFLSRLFQ
jgi:hypothetical protein